MARNRRKFSPEIEESWARVTAWLAANAPASYARLSPPAFPSELDACEDDLKVALPAELRRLLLVLGTLRLVLVSGALSDYVDRRWSSWPGLA